MMQALDKNLRTALEKTVKAARTVAETAALAAVEQLGVGQDKPEPFLSDVEKALRNRLRTHGKQLGDARDSKSTNPTYGKQDVHHLVQEVAYQHWHRMLFARFLADNNLLMYDGVAVTIEECDELAPDEGAKSGWELAGKLAARMLPQVFKPGSPVFELTFAPEHQSELESLLKDLPDAVFKASDSLGWVYQFWQSDNKDRINKSEVKIGADELPAVTQLFTEPYMVAFLMHNSLGAWWATRYPNKPCPVNLDYFRTLEDGSPAAGKFEGWPNSLDKFKLLDPCCGSGHFLVAAFLMLVPMRMAAEALSAKEAVDRVLDENIHGLELDPRCVEIAVFAVALEAWRYPDELGMPLGVRRIPQPKIACSGLQVAATLTDWEDLVPKDHDDQESLKAGLRQLHATFLQAPLLGSLLSPKEIHKNDLFSANYDKLIGLLELALNAERSEGYHEGAESSWDSAISARGLLSVATILNSRFTLIATNFPFLGIEKQTIELRDYLKETYPEGYRELAVSFLLRSRNLLEKDGAVAVVTPGEWTFLRPHRHFREHILRTSTLNIICKLGWGAFQSGIRAQPVLLVSQLNRSPSTQSEAVYLELKGKSIEEKQSELQKDALAVCYQHHWIDTPDSRIAFSSGEKVTTLGGFCDARTGMSAGDSERFERNYWEVPNFGSQWEFLQSSVSSLSNFAGRSRIVFWEQEKGSMFMLAESVKHLNHAAQNWRRGKPNWGKRGVVISLMGDLPCTLYTGEIYDINCCAIVPKDIKHLNAIAAYALSGELGAAIRSFDTSLKVGSPKTLLSADFDLDYWSQIARETFPDGLPRQFSNDPTQWIFHGHPQPSTAPLQVAVARLVGYIWPAEFGGCNDLSIDAQHLISKSKLLARHADNDGIVCIPPVGQEASASDRLINLLADAYGEEWSNETLSQLLSAADANGKNLEIWLRDKFFTQHCKLFESRPFVWHVWDGLPDGFAALVNYHRLDHKTLEALIYTYLGDWISRQKRDVEARIDGAQERLGAAEALKKRLELILIGEAPYDIFVRWKPIQEQPISWNPDLNDGVRMNIRPFLSVPDVGKRGAGVLRDKPKSLHWNKDRGSDVETAPWYKLGLQFGGKVGDRINDHHLGLNDKRAARETAK